MMALLPNDRKRQLNHLAHLDELNRQQGQDFVTRATGKYYTPPEVGKQLAQSLVLKFREPQRPRTIRIADPFAGDGRLVIWLIEQWEMQERGAVEWEVLLWDIADEGLKVARNKLERLRRGGTKLKSKCVSADSFLASSKDVEPFDVVVTNPPWELLKPDRRELKVLGAKRKTQYVESLRDYDSVLQQLYPNAQPLKKFAGWGTNLSRVGLAASLRLCANGGFLGIVLPASFLADDQSARLRDELLEKHTLHEISHYPAEAKLFKGVDVPIVTLVSECRPASRIEPLIVRYDKHLSVVSRGPIRLEGNFVGATGGIIPTSIGSSAFTVLQHLVLSFPMVQSLESDDTSSLWAGRELDETGIAKNLRVGAGGTRFLKGRMIVRFGFSNDQRHALRSIEKPLPPSSQHERIAWRDVSRPNQKRRMVASVVPAGCVTGNSLSVAYFKDDNSTALRILLGVMNSLVFEFQLRAHLATGHVSLAALRKVRIPPLGELLKHKQVGDLVESLLGGGEGAELDLEAYVAKCVYGLSRRQFALVASSFPKLTPAERAELDATYRRTRYRGIRDDDAAKAYTDSAIPNHYSAKLSDLDMRMVEVVPQGGNWKNIPESIPSKRLEKIRIDFRAGKGSRSTYYGRLRPDKPSYTINTYFNRPGNGCHMHYDEDRVLSQREAARLQSFPDSFHFRGPKGAINTQIGNAVPPLLAFQLAQTLGKPGHFVDLFSGAGGMGLGFVWAGWTPIVANDIEPHFLETYCLNVHDSAVLGSISDANVRSELVSIVSRFRRQESRSPLWILGGPPCQGFSTGGMVRTMDDPRNHLFRDYISIIDEVKPDGCLFENVTGLLNMNGGAVFSEVKDAFQDAMPHIVAKVVSTELYAIPQRRKRVILIGHRDTDFEPDELEATTSCEQEEGLFAPLQDAISTREALSDLPSLSNGQDGSSLSYRCGPTTAYQELMRGMIQPAEYLDRIRSGNRAAVQHRSSAGAGACQHGEGSRSDQLIGNKKGRS